MRTQLAQTVSLGELVEVVFDEAAQYDLDPKEVARLATQAVLHMLRRARGRAAHRR